MAQPDDENFVWGLGCVAHAKVESAERHHDVEVRQLLADAERETVSAAIGYVWGFIDNPYSRLADSVDAYFENIQRLTQALATGSFQKVSADSSQSEKFSRVLHLFRTYHDRTRSALKRKYGAKSGELAAFDRAREKAAKESFAYRFFAQLRNEDQHSRQVLHLAASGGISASGESHHVVTATVRNEILDGASAPGSRWDKRLAKKVSELSRPVYVDPLLTQFIETVTRIEARRLVAEAAQIENATALLRSASADLKCENSNPALIGLILDEAGGEKVVRQMRVTEISPRVLSSLETALQNARVAIAETV